MKLSRSEAASYLRTASLAEEARARNEDTRSFKTDSPQYFSSIFAERCHDCAWMLENRDGYNLTYDEKYCQMSGNTSTHLEDQLEHALKVRLDSIGAAHRWMKPDYDGYISKTSATEFLTTARKYGFLARVLIAAGIECRSHRHTREELNRLLRKSGRNKEMAQVMTELIEEGELILHTENSAYGWKILKLAKDLRKFREMYENVQ